MSKSTSCFDVFAVVLRHIFSFLLVLFLAPVIRHNIGRLSAALDVSAKEVTLCLHPPLTDANLHIICDEVLIATA